MALTCSGWSAVTEPQALVAGIAAEHGLPFLVISAGTRNHFALDLGLDREDPATCLDALADGQELRVDLGIIGDRTFVNNASFGAYAEVVRSPAYRDDKRGTTLRMLPDLLNGHQGAHLSAQAAGVRIEGPQALLVSNDPYEMSDIAGLGRRARLDAGTLGVVAVRVDTARQAIELARHGHGHGLTMITTGEVTVDAPEIPVGIDGETVILPTPVHCTIQPRALRVIVPGNGPASPPPRQPWNGRGSATSRPSTPSQTATPSPPSQAGSRLTRTVEADGCPSFRLAAVKCHRSTHVAVCQAWLGESRCWAVDSFSKAGRHRGPCAHLEWMMCSSPPSAMVWAWFVPSHGLSWPYGCEPSGRSGPRR